MAIDIFSSSTYGALLSEVNKKIKDALIDNPRVLLVEELPKTDIIDGVIYLIPSQDPDTENIYDEWVHMNGKWEVIGNKKIDLSDYVTHEYLSELIESIEDDLKDLREGKVDKDLFDELKEQVDEMKLYKFPNAIIHGEPTINNGQVSGFSETSYLTLPSVFDLQGRGFELKLAFTTNNDITTAQNVLGSNYCMALYVANSKLSFRVSSNGTSWDLVSKDADKTLTAKTTYYVKISFNRLVYKLSLSIDDETYEDLITVNTGDASPHPSLLYLGVGNNFHNPFKGIINLNKCYLKVNNSIIWQGMDDAGLSTRLATDLENIDEVGVEKIKEIVSDKADKVEVNARLQNNASKNLLNTKSVNRNGIIVNDDGSVTSTLPSDVRPWTYEKCDVFMVLEPGTYYIRVMNTDTGSLPKLNIKIISSDNSMIFQSHGNVVLNKDYSFILHEKTDVGVIFKLYSDDIIDGKPIQFSLSRFENAEYEPYYPTNVELDNNKLDKSGGIITGDLSVNGTTTIGNATLQYDSTNNCLKFNFNATSTASALSLEDEVIE